MENLRGLLDSVKVVFLLLLQLLERILSTAKFFDRAHSFLANVFLGTVILRFNFVITRGFYVLQHHLRLYQIDACVVLPPVYYHNIISS